jgi:hypothetical protein
MWVIIVILKMLKGSGRRKTIGSFDVTMGKKFIGGD